MPNNAPHIQREFTREQIIKLVLALGSDDYKEDSSADDRPIVFQTICHNPAHCGSYKLYYYPESKQFHCYTECSCNYDIYDLIQKVKDCTFPEAVNFVQNVLNLSAVAPVNGYSGFFQAEPTTSLTEDWALLAKYKSRINQANATQAIPINQGPSHILQPEPFKEISPNILDYYSSARIVEWEKEGISYDAVKRFGIRFSIADNEIIIPHYDAQNRLIGIRSRCLDPYAIDNGGKYRPTRLEGSDFRHPIRNNLFGLNVCLPAIQRIKKIMICESEKASLQSYTMYGDKSFVVAVCGSHISTAQRDMILSLGVKEVFIAMDKEYHQIGTPESDTYKEKLAYLAGMFAPYMVTYIVADTGNLLRYKDSPTDRGRKVLEQLMEQKFEAWTKS